MAEQTGSGILDLGSDARIGTRITGAFAFLLAMTILFGVKAAYDVSETAIATEICTLTRSP